MYQAVLSGVWAVASWASVNTLRGIQSRLLSASPLSLPAARWSLEDRQQLPECVCNKLEFCRNELFGVATLSISTWEVLSPPLYHSK